MASTVPQQMAVAKNQNHYFQFWGKNNTTWMHVAVNCHEIKKEIISTYPEIKIIITW